jgi:hypothetical protein
MEQKQQLKKDTLYWVKFSELEDWAVAEHYSSNVWYVIGSKYQRYTTDFYEIGKEVTKEC